MAAGSAIDTVAQPLQPRSSIKHRTKSVFCPDSGAVIHPARRTHSGLGSTHKTSEEARSLSCLASLLKPILGNDAKQCAERLLHRFGTTARVMNATKEALQNTLSDLPAATEAILATRELARVAQDEQLVGKPFRPSDKAFQRYLIDQIDKPHFESLFAVFLDSDGLLLKAELAASGSRNTLLANFRTLTHRALDLSCSEIVLAHNHPSGSCIPSQEDVVATNQLKAILQIVDVRLGDHLIVSRNRIFSMRLGRLL